MCANKGHVLRAGCRRNGWRWQPRKVLLIGACQITRRRGVAIISGRSAWRTKKTSHPVGRWKLNRGSLQRGQQPANWTRANFALRSNEQPVAAKRDSFSASSSQLDVITRREALLLDRCTFGCLADWCKVMDERRNLGDEDGFGSRTTGESGSRRNWVNWNVGARWLAWCTTFSRGMILYRGHSQRPEI